MWRTRFKRRSTAGRVRGDVYCKELIMYHCISKTLEYSSTESKTASETWLTVLRRGRKFLRIEKSLLNSLSVLPGVGRDSYNLYYKLY